MQASDFQPKGKADWVATIMGVVSLLGGGGLLWQELIGQWVFGAMFGVGLYLIVPLRATAFGRWLKELVPIFRD